MDPFPRTDDSPPQGFWAELRRGSTFLMVPEPAWLRLLGHPSYHIGDEPVWDEAGNAWLVSAATAEAMSAAAQTTHLYYFEYTFASSGSRIERRTTHAATVTKDAVEPLRDDLAAFLRLGSFSWKFILA